MIGIDVKSAKLAVSRYVRVARGSGGRESVDGAHFDRNNRRRLQGVGGLKTVLLCPVLGAKLIEVLVGKQSAIPRLPRSNMHARNGQCIVRFRRPAAYLRIVKHTPSAGVFPIATNSARHTSTAIR